MGSDDEDHNATVYVEEYADEEDEDGSEEEDQTLQNQQIDEDDVDLIDEEEEENDSMSSAAGEVTIAVAGVPNVATTVAATPTTATTTTTSAVRSDAIVETKKPLDDSRRLFQRLWTDEDEIELLQGFLDYTTQRGTNNSSHHHHDTAAFYDQIKGKLQLDFNKNQLVEKLRRLKKKYRNVLSKTSSGKEYVFKSPHDQATFDISCKIWGETAATPVSILAAGDGGGIYDEEPHNPNPNCYPNFNSNEHNGHEIGDHNSSEKKVPRSRKRSRSNTVKIEDIYNQQQQQQQFGQAQAVALGSSNAVTPNVAEETVNNCLLPLFKELVNNFTNGASGNSRGLGLGGMIFPIGDITDDKWRKQHIIELEVYLKRLELMQDQIKSKLEELRSIGS